MPSTSILGDLQPGFAYRVVNLGCKVNKVESDTIATALEARGGVAASEEDARIIVVNTCTVTGEADKKARKAVRHALKVAPHARVVVTGCAVAIDQNTYQAMDERVRIVQRVDLLGELGAGAADGNLRVGENFRTRVGLKVQDGCDRACTYCIVHVARGPAFSIPCQHVVSEAERYLAGGVKELVLTGIDLGSYRDGSIGLAQLVQTLLESADRLAGPNEVPARIRASSLEPHSLDERFIDLLAASEGRLCRHLHLPVQSGNSKVLREMARPYSAERFRGIVDDLYRRVPNLSLTTDVICGFPGETEDEFQDTLDLARACRFSKIHVFPYSRREGTPAAARRDQVSAEAKSARCAQLRLLADDLRRGDLAARAGTEEWALVQDDIALTESYHEVSVPAPAKPGELVRVSL